MASINNSARERVSAPIYSRTRAEHSRALLVLKPKRLVYTPIAKTTARSFALSLSVSFLSATKLAPPFHVCLTPKPTQPLSFLTRHEIQFDYSNMFMELRFCLSSLIFFFSSIQCHIRNLCWQMKTSACLYYKVIFNYLFITVN